MTRNDYLALCEQIWAHNRAYYIDAKPVISDFAYDQLLKQVEALEKQHPDWISPSSPTQRVCEMPSTEFKTVAHSQPMLSLANTYDAEELADFMMRVEKGVGHGELSYICELKMDGAALSLVYEKGELVRAVTRGNGQEGDDVTQNVRTIANLPLRLSEPISCDVRGEVYMSHAQLATLNTQREEAGLEPFANCRNAAAGSLKLLDSREAAKRGLSVLCYGLVQTELPTQEAVLAELKKWGLPTQSFVRKVTAIDELLAYIEEARQLRAKLPYDIDGIVVKLDNLKLQKKLGATGKIPRFATSYKFAPEQARTEVLGITVQVGRTGVLTPVAELTPVLLAGSTISRATLHNEQEVARLDVRLHDEVLIEKGGDVIPKVVAVLPSAHRKAVWRMPEHCPECSTQVVREAGLIAVRCPNKLCPAQSLGRLCHFVSKSALDIEHLGPAILEQLVQKGFAKTPADLYDLSAEQLMQLEGFKEKSTQNVLASLQKSKSTSLSRLLVGLGIPHIGVNTADLLARKFGSLQALQEATPEALLAVEGVGEIVASSIQTFFASSANQDEIRRLLSHITPTVDAILEEKPFFAGKTFVLTGTLESLSRPQASSLIKERGGKVSSSVSKKTDYVLAGSEAGSKLEDAIRLGVRVLTEEEFRAQL